MRFRLRSTDEDAYFRAAGKVADAGPWWTRIMEKLSSNRGVPEKVRELYRKPRRMSHSQRSA